MARYGLVVVGGGPAALSAVESFRHAGGAGQVALVSDDDAPPYERPALTKDFLRGETDADALALADSGFWCSAGVELRLGTRATRLDPAARVVSLADGQRLVYDSCVLATGSVPARLPVPGADHPDVLVLRSLAQGRRLRAAAAAASTAVVVGSGFIGCEAAASLAARGLVVTVVTREELPQRARLGAAAGERIAAWLRADGVRLVTGADVTRIVEGRQVEIGAGKAVEGDLVLTAGGIAPSVGLADAAGLSVRQGRVSVDASMRSSALGVLAAGDMALAFNAAAGRELVVEHWGEALAMGEVAGSVAADRVAEWAQAPGFFSDIGGRLLKHVAWGDGHDSARLVDHGDESFTVWYGQAGVAVGVLTHEADDDYERGRELVEASAPLPPEGSPA